MRATRSLQSHCNTEKVEGKKLLDAGNLIEVPGMIWEICQVLVGETCGGKSSLDLQKVGHGSILLRNVLSIFAHRCCIYSNFTFIIINKLFDIM